MAEKEEARLERLFFLVRVLHVEGRLGEIAVSKRKEQENERALSPALNLVVCLTSVLYDSRSFYVSISSRVSPFSCFRWSKHEPLSFAISPCQFINSSFSIVLVLAPHDPLSLFPLVLSLIPGSSAVPSGKATICAAR